MFTKQQLDNHQFKIIRLMGKICGTGVPLIIIPGFQFQICICILINLENKDFLTGQFGSGCAPKKPQGIFRSWLLSLNERQCLYFFGGISPLFPICVRQITTCKRTGREIVLTGGLRAANRGLVCGDAGVTERYANRTKKDGEGWNREGDRKKTQQPQNKQTEKTVTDEKDDSRRRR